MTRFDEDSLALHLEVALTVAPPALLGKLGAPDRHLRQSAVGEIARHLVERLRCVDMRCDEDAGLRQHPSLFPENPGPAG
jgi:hypothetical protein